MTETIFKPGQEYRTRDGRRARVYATDGDKDKEIHGAIHDGRSWYPEDWTAAGLYFGDGDETANDLMPPEPERFLLWGARDATGRDTVLEVEIQPDGTMRAVR